MESMFSGCTNIENINFGNINTNSLENLYETFKGCSTLQIIDLSKFETSKVTTMEGMFQNCSSFRFLDLSNFLTPKVETAKNMFASSYSLRYLNLLKFQFKSTVEWENIFGYLRDDVIYCLLDEPTKIMTLIPDEYWFCHVDCSNINRIKVDFFNKKCLED